MHYFARHIESCTVQREGYLTLDNIVQCILTIAQYCVKIFSVTVYQASILGVAQYYARLYSVMQYRAMVVLLVQSIYSVAQYCARHIQSCIKFCKSLVHFARHIQCCTILCNGVFFRSRHITYHAILPEAYSVLHNIVSCTHCYLKSSREKRYVVHCLFTVAQYYAMVVLCYQGIFSVMQLCTRHIQCCTILHKAIECHAIFCKAC